MDLKKIAGLTVFCGALSLNASFISAISGADTCEDLYKPSKERGIIVSQDVDGDGIIDSEDDDLNSKPCEVVKKPKPKIIPDSDGDGYKDNVDQCPDTPVGFEVDDTGCSKIVNLNVLFDIDKATIRNGSTSKIDKLINFLEKYEEYSVVIEGHTDSDASDSYNMTLSKNRALAVTKYILDNSSISKERVSTQWYGESRPLNSNSTKDEKQANRRVMAILNK